MKPAQQSHSLANPTKLLTSLVALPLLCTACPAPENGAWADTEATGGPQVRYDIAAQPLPEIPLPNDAATRLDPASPTGRYLNISEDGPTQYERDVRAKFNRLDGFGAYAPIFVSFDRPLDVVDLHQRHENDDDFRNDAVFLLNVDPDCTRYGEEVALDMGGGHFPTALWRRDELRADPEAPNGYVRRGGNRYFPHDIHGTYTNSLFEERNEDLNNNGELDPGEDVDMDGLLDVANLFDPHACDNVDPTSVAHAQCIQDNLLTFYERQTNTLILRPLWPLQQQCTYAVVLTKRLKGETGLPIQSPFPGINHRDQTRDLEPAEEFLGRYDLDVSDIAFAWTFTVGSMTRDIESLRAGLYGHGPFERLADEFGVGDLHIWTREELAALKEDRPTSGRENERLFDGACVGNAISWLWGPGLAEWEPNLCAIEADLSSLGGLFGGTFRAPNLLVDKEGLANEFYPSDHDENWEMNWQTGDAVYGDTDVTFWCALPKELDFSCSPGNPEGAPFCKPFPVHFYGHGYGGSKAEITLHMGRHAGMGYALCSIDAYGHGLNRWLFDENEGFALVVAAERFGAAGVRELSTLLTYGRDRDLNNDGVADPGMDMWTSDVFHTRDMVRQSVLEEIQWVRILRHMDGSTTDSNGDLLGDIDQDGVVDLGGPDNSVGMWGISLGGILSGVAAGAEPSLDAVSPNAGGAGLTDISTRSSQAGVPEAVIMPMLGQLVAGCLPQDDHQRPVTEGTGSDCLEVGSEAEAGELRLTFYAQDQARLRELWFATIPGVEVGDRVELHNLTNDEMGISRINEYGWFRTSVAADALDAMDRRPLLGLTGRQRGPIESKDNLALADALEIRVFKGDSDELRGKVNTFERKVSFQGTEYVVDSPLVALQQGFGYQRNHPDFRRFIGFAQHAISSADPAVWGAHSFIEPLDVSYDPFRQGGNTRVLMMPTTGDANVPVSTGIAMGRVSGFLGDWRRDEKRFGPETGWREIFQVDSRYGTSIDQWLIDVWAVEGVPSLQRWKGNDPIAPNALYDVDNVSDGTASFSCGPSDWSALIGENECADDFEGQEVFFSVPHPEPGKELRQDWLRDNGRKDAFRMPLLRPSGQHGIYNSQSFRTFDADAYMVDFTVRYLGTRGMNTNHESGCDCSASGLPRWELNGTPDTPALGEACSVDNMKVCNDTCVQAWGFRTPELATCSVP